MASDSKRGSHTEIAGSPGGAAPSTTGAHPAASSSAAIPEQEASMVGEVLDGRYRIIKKLGEGGMGEVYAAEHVHIEKRVAVKLLRPEIVSNKEAVSRFRQEARSASSIGHKNIIAIEDFGQLPDGRIYLCMELLNGAPLNDLIQQPMPQDRLLNILIQTGHGLAAAHAKGIVHRDMKPENIFVTIAPNGEDVPKLLDFGIAKVAGNDGQNNLTRTGTIFGTPFYMAPEQALGQAVDARADVYAMGVIMYEVFSGSVPFQGESFMGILTQHITTEPEPVAQRAARAGRQLPPGLAEVIGHCLQKEPDRRYRTMDELVQALVQVYRTVAGAGMSTYMEAYVPAPTGQGGVPRPPTGGVPGTGSAAHMPTVGMLPPQPHGYTPQPMPPQPHGYTPQPMPPQPMGGMSPPMGVPPVPGPSVAMSSVEVPKSGGRAGLVVAILAILVVAGGVVAFVLFGQGKGGKDKEGPGGDGTDKIGGQNPPQKADAGPIAVVTPDAAVPAKTPDAGAAPETADAAVVVAEPVVVLVSANARKAVIYENGTKLGEAPKNIKVMPGETRTLVVKAKGYKDATVTIDGTREEVDVDLAHIDTGRPDHRPDTTRPDTTTPVDPLKELCKKNPSDKRCLMQDD